MFSSHAAFSVPLADVQADSPRIEFVSSGAGLHALNRFLEKDGAERIDGFFNFSVL